MSSLRRFFRSFLASKSALAFTFVLFVFFYNEYLIYWQTLSKCDWPHKPTQQHLLNVMLLSDTHLLGSRNGHWFDKLRREWQQRRAFQTARALLQPHYIVITGDITDEGKWCSDAEWRYYEARVRDLFAPGHTSKLLFTVGNHDVGFHYDLQKHKIERFDRSFSTDHIKLYFPQERSDVSFVFVNSMSLENDSCQFCRKAQEQLMRVNKTLTCLKQSGAGGCNLERTDIVYSRPILFTHFPLYRQSDALCPHDIDSESYYVKEGSSFKTKYDCLAVEATRQLLDMTNARLVFNGHTHYSCYNEKHNVPEYTLASFSWRNIKQPSMLLLQVDAQNHYVTKCFLPNENTVIFVYFISALCLVLAVLYQCLKVYSPTSLKRKASVASTFHCAQMNRIKLN